MSQITYRANLSAKAFPFIAENFGRSIIVPQYDNAFNRQVQSDQDSDKDIGIPQIYYCHNVMPHPQGFQSIGYTQVINPFAGGFKAISVLRDEGDNKIYMGIANNGDFLVYDGSTWVLKMNVSQAVNGLVTQAFVSGTTYIYVQDYGCFYYDFGLGTFTSVTLTGLNITGVDGTVGITSSAGYMIAWNKTAVAWSSTLDPTDFVPSLVTGAGGGSVEGAKGSITLCVPHLLGFIVYTSANAVAALYSGNSRFPYNFREIVASGGVASLDLIAYDSNSGNHYAYTTSGFQLISTSQSQTVFPDLTDFIAGKLFEDFDTTTNTFTTVALSQTMKKKLSVVSDRYMVISYGTLSFTHAIVYDLVEKRYGKLKIPHVTSFEYQLTSAAITETPRQSLAFLQDSGAVQVVDFSVSSPTSDGVMILGKYQFVRARLLEIQEIALENIRVGANYSLTLFSTLDGKNYTQSTPYLDLNAGLFRRYKTKKVGLNHSMLHKGAFEICSFVLSFNIHGKR